MQGLKLKGISKSFGKTQILESLDLDIKAEEFLVLVGPSGSGKSTIIRIIAGLENQDQGSISLDEKQIEEAAPKDRDLSMVFQNYALYPHKTVFDNIAFPLLMAKEEPEVISEKVEQIALKLELNDYLERKPKELSGGQRQRVALARAMIKKPKVFLMDEPLSNLDAKLRAQMRVEIHKLHKDSKNIFIYVTHDQLEALTLGDRIVVLDKGAVQQIASPSEVYNNPQNSFVASFIGNPPTNLIKDPERDVLQGIRPEFIKLSKTDDDDVVIEAKIVNIELLGSEYLIHTKYLDEPLIAKISIDSKDENISIGNLYKNYQIDESIKLYFPQNKVYFFDLATGKRV